LHKEQGQRKENYASSRKSPHSCKGKGERKAPSPEKKKVVSEDQEGCRQTSQQTSPD